CAVSPVSHTMRSASARIPDTSYRPRTVTPLRSTVSMARMRPLVSTRPRAAGSRRQTAHRVKPVGSLSGETEGEDVTRLSSPHHRQGANRGSVVIPAEDRPRHETDRDDRDGRAAHDPRHGVLLVGDLRPLDELARALGHVELVLELIQGVGQLVAGLGRSALGGRSGVTLRYLASPRPLWRR